MRPHGRDGYYWPRSMRIAPELPPTSGWVFRSPKVRC